MINKTLHANKEGIYEVRENVFSLKNEEMDIVETLIDAYQYGLREALNIVIDEEYVTYEGCDTVKQVAKKLVREGAYGDIEIGSAAERYLDYDTMADDLEDKYVFYIGGINIIRLKR